MQQLSACVTLAIVLFVACAREDEIGTVGERDTLQGEDLALPPSAGAPRGDVTGEMPDTLTTEEAAPLDTTTPGPTETVGPVPPERLHVDAIVNAYRRYYQEIFAEFGSDVRGGVDPEMVEEAKHRTALEFGFVDVQAWNDMVSELTPSQRAELAPRIAAANRDLGQQLHTGRAPTTG
jgi:hypothetical protein